VQYSLDHDLPHPFHAGSFAYVLKDVLLIMLIEQLKEKPGPVPHDPSS
jgi:23S rRNA A2030 N6-methylase RlmJ